MHSEKSDTQKFWLGLLRDVLSLEKPEEYIEFEKTVELSHKSFIDAYIPSTGIVIEQKSQSVNLDAPAKQSDGTLATPFEQAKRYRDWLPASEQGRYIVVCNFRELRIHDMETPKAPPRVLQVEHVRQENLSFLINPKREQTREEKISLEAGRLVGRLYRAVQAKYIHPDNEASQKSLNVFCVRLVFLLYAEDSGLFKKGQFHDYLRVRKRFARDAFRKLFVVLNQKPEERDPYLEADLQAFPYVNGGLFSGSDIELPQLDGEPLRIILEEMSEGFDWSEISPTIFGAVFESTLNPATRHSGGMHYTSVENIHKVIDPLFMDELNAEANILIKQPPSSTRTRRLRNFQKRVSKITFFDPACGSGNFLTESYLSLRRLENRIITELAGSQIRFAFSREETPIQVNISQFIGIEINDFAVSVAKTALWIAESQMWNETRTIIHLSEDFLPLRLEGNIIEDNALHVDWLSLLPISGQVYIMGNPPFLGYSMQNGNQKKDILSLYSLGKLDYVAGWYYKASEIVQDTRVRAAFVSTNSITQGEQVTSIFKTLHEKYGIEIDFAHQTFEWNSEATDQAHVHVVVIGFDTIKEEGKLRRLYTSEGLKLVENINFYLVAAPNDFAESTTKAVSKQAPAIMGGNRPADGGHLIIEAEDYEDFIKREPKAKPYIKRYMMGREFINNFPRYCLWLVEISPKELEDRLKGAADRRKLADTPHLFRETLNPKQYLAIPETSSGSRKYIPMGWLDDSVIPGNGLRIIPDATLYDFGVLTSRVHMAWVIVVCGRLKSDYRYSKNVVYNTFAWPSPTEEQRKRIELTAQGILDARAQHPECSLADLYDDTAMPLDLREAHRANDVAVCEAYGFPKEIGDDDTVAQLFDLYHGLISTAK